MDDVVWREPERRDEPVVLAVHRIAEGDVTLQSPSREDAPADTPPPDDSED
jgi:hypothetical protein